MIADVTAFEAYGMVLTIILGVIILSGFLKGFLNGFWKSVVSLVLWIALIIGLVKFGPGIGEQLATTGFLEGLLSGVEGTEIGDFVLGLIGPTIYTVVVFVLGLIAGAIVIGLLNAIIKSLFRRKRFLSRIVGMICSGVFNLALATVLFILASSPLLFKGADEKVNNDQLLSTYNQIVVEPIQDILKQNNLPSEVDELALVLLGQEVNEENISSLNRIVDIMHDPKAYVDVLVDEQGNVDEVKAKEAFTDLVFLSKIVNDMDEGTSRDSLNDSLQKALEEVVKELENNEGQPIETVKVSQGDKEALNTYMANLGFEKSLEDRINAVFVVE